ncbi:hypothetical protein I309_06128 [Cryptococcus deuterogattii LA55]|nr:hypothetical protein I309_06128 [Cryptococcus deuterogattii LA55]KIR91186.1 hypothetical protein I304_05282 [Cryptococcus deuterogattii CBS 10090]
MPTYLRTLPTSPPSLIHAFSTVCKKMNMTGVEQPRPSLGPNRSSNSSLIQIRSLADSSPNNLKSDVRTASFPPETDVDVEAQPSTSFSRWTKYDRSPTSKATDLSGFGNGIRHRHVSLSSNNSSRNADHYRWLNTSTVVGTGDEPGVDVKSKRDQKNYGHLKGSTHIKVVDYCSNPDQDCMNRSSDFPGEKLQEWLDSEHGKRQVDENGKPMGVRWIHVDGVNWEVVKALVLHFGLHPLAVEDSLEASESPRSKLDFYKNHLYLQLLIHHSQISEKDTLDILADDMVEGAYRKGQGGTHPRKKRWFSQRVRGVFEGEHKKPRLPEGVQGAFEPSMISPRRTIGMHRTQEKQAHKLTVEELSAQYMVPIHRSILSIFMLRDGTLISMDAKPTKEVLSPIYTRLEDEQSLLRRSGDVSMLAQAILDTVVDLAIEVSQRFESEILKLEASVLVDPEMETVRHLHVLSSQLIRLRRSLTPLLHVCYVIRDQDIQRSAAATAVGQGYGGETNENAEGSRKEQDGLGHSAGRMSGTGAAAGAGMEYNPFSPPSGGSQHSQAMSFTDFAQPQPRPLMPSHNVAPTAPPTSSISRGVSRSSTPVSGVVPRARQSDTDAASVLSMMNLHQSYKNLAALGTPHTGVGIGAASLGFFSPLTKVYIEDVIDHLEIIVGSLEQFVSTCDHLTDYVFNALSFQTNASMERLSIVTVVFLPLTFIVSATTCTAIASYFGMNFTGFDQIEGPVSYFWKVAIPCTVAFFIVFSFGYIKRFAITTARRFARWRRARALIANSKKMDRAPGRKGT